MAEENGNKYAAILVQAFDQVLKTRYGNSIPPEPLLTYTGIKHLDAILGGGITSSSYVMLSSTPESGKSTTALQICALFQKQHESSTCVYIDTESAAGGTSADVEDRILTFGIDKSRFLYVPSVMNLHEIFEMISNFVTLKRDLREKKDVKSDLLIVWDSIASTPSSKDEDAEDPNSVIGYKARELTFELTRNKSVLSMEQVTCIVIDQIRDNIQLKMPWQIAMEEKTVGTFGNMKSATNIKSLQHAVRQWLFLSKGQVLLPTDPMGIDGWVLNIYLEKNKLAPSQYSVPVIFDKKFGIHPRWSEFWFLANKTKSENKLYPKDKKMPYPLLISGTPTKRVLTVINPEDMTEMYSNQFRESNFIDMYNNDENFRQWFDYAVHVSVQQRIIQGMFRSQVNDTTVTEEEQAQMIEQINPETGEVSYVPADDEYVDTGEQVQMTSTD